MVFVGLGVEEAWDCGMADYLLFSELKTGKEAKGPPTPQDARKFKKKLETKEGLRHGADG